MPIRLSLVRRQIIWLPSWLIRHRVRLAGEQLGVPSDPRRKEATVVSMLSKGAAEMPDVVVLVSSAGHEHAFGFTSELMQAASFHLVHKLRKQVSKCPLPPSVSAFAASR